MKEFILIVIIFAGDYNPVFEMQEFNSRSTCERAKIILENDQDLDSILPRNFWLDRTSFIKCVEK